MDWKHFAIATRRKVVATALMYGLSMTVRLTSPTAEEVPAQITQGTKAAASILIDHGWPGNPVMPAALRGWPSGPGSCSAACEGPALTSSLPNCIAP